MFDNGVWSRFTTGAYFNNQFGKLSTTASAYYQGGKNFTGQNVSAALASISAQYAVAKSFGLGAGFDYTTGGTNGETSKAFDPLYGTPHKFWGFMDYFYVASGFGAKGLADAYVKAKWKPSGKWQFGADVHQFSSASEVLDASGKSLSKNFGTEIDLVGSWTISSIVGLEAGYSHFFSTTTLATVKNVSNPQSSNSWAYVMLNIKPNFLKH